MRAPALSFTVEDEKRGPLPTAVLILEPELDLSVPTALPRRDPVRTAPAVTVVVAVASPVPAFSVSLLLLLDTAAEAVDAKLLSA